MKDRGAWDHSAVQNQSFATLGRHSPNIVGVHRDSLAGISEGDFFYFCAPVTDFYKDMVVNWIKFRSHSERINIRIYFNVNEPDGISKRGYILNAADEEHPDYRRRLPRFYSADTLGIAVGDGWYVMDTFIDTNYEYKKIEFREKLIIPDVNTVDIDNYKPNIAFKLHDVDGAAVECQSLQYIVSITMSDLYK